MIHPLYAVTPEAARIASSVPSEAGETEAPRRIPAPVIESCFSNTQHVEACLSARSVGNAHSPCQTSLVSLKRISRVSCRDGAKVAAIQRELAVTV